MSRPKVQRQASSWVLLGCLAYVMWRPVSEPQLLYSALGVIALLSGWRVLTRGSAAPRSLTLPMAGIYAAALSAFVVGTVRDNPGVSQQGLVWLGGLLIWGLFALSMDDSLATDLFRLVSVMSIVLSALILLYVLQNVGILPAILPSSLITDQGAMFDFADGDVAIRFYGLSTLAAAGPFCVAATLAPRDRLLPSRQLTGTAAAFAMAASLIAGRRAILAVMILTPLLYLLVRWVLRPRREAARPRLHPAWVAASLVLIAGTVWGLSTSWVERIGSAFRAGLGVFFDWGDLANNVSDQQRVLQVGELLAGWSDYPLVGSGLGAVLGATFSRSAARPWMFELQYHQMLFNLGLIGCAVILLSGVVAAAAFRSIARLAPGHQGSLVSAVTTSTALLIANATNPYLQAVGHGWGVAISVATGVAICSVHPPRAGSTVGATVEIDPVRLADQSLRTGVNQ